jgi:hypothetical protein
VSIERRKANSWKHYLPPSIIPYGASIPSSLQNPAMVLSISATFLPDRGFLRHGVEVNLFFRFKSIDIARDIEVVIVVTDLFQRRDMAVLLERFPVVIGIGNLVDMLRQGGSEFSPFQSHCWRR